MVVAVITVIEALRAYDIIAALNTPRGTEVMGTLVTTQPARRGWRASRHRFGLRHGAVRPVHRVHHLVRHQRLPPGDALMAVVTAPVDATGRRRHRRADTTGSHQADARCCCTWSSPCSRLAWLVPIGTAVYSSFRYFEADTQVNGVFSAARHAHARQLPRCLERRATSAATSSRRRSSCFRRWC